MDGQPIRLLIVDDHAIFREGIRLLLSRHSDYEVVAEADSYHGAAEALAANDVDCLVLDYCMPDASGVEGIELIRRRWPELRVVLLTGIDSGLVLGAVMRTGINAVVLKEGRGDELLDALASLDDEECYVSPAAVEHLEDSGETMLTRREYQVLSLLAEGLSNKQIAGELFISAKTVDKHRTSLMHKFDIHTTAELVARGVRAGYIS